MAVRPRVASAPWWAEATIVAAIFGSWAAALYLAPRYFSPDASQPTQYLLASVPFFFVLMIVEGLVIWLSKFSSKAAQYEFADAWSSIVAGTTQQQLQGQVFNRITHLYAPLLTYSYVWENFAIYRFQLDTSLSWLVVILVADFLYYINHRLGHDLAFLWAGHSVHHSSDHYNLSTALRQSVWQGVYSHAFTLPAALFFPPGFFAVVNQWNTIYQFWVHTCVVRRLGPLEWIFMTPSHHRVHHDRRVHKNFGGLFIIWDRLFGTFLDEEEGARDSGEVAFLGDDDQEEATNPTLPEEICLFGIKAPVRSWTEAVLQMEMPAALVLRVARAAVSSPLTALKRAFQGPGYYTSTAARSLRFPSASAQRIRHAALLPWAGVAYHLVHTTLMLVFGLYLRLAWPGTFVDAMAWAGLMLGSLAIQGLLMDHCLWAVHVERLRTVALTAVLCTSEPAWLSHAETRVVLLALFALSALVAIARPAWILSSWSFPDPIPAVLKDKEADAIDAEKSSSTQQRAKPQSKKPAASPSTTSPPPITTPVAKATGATNAPTNGCIPM